MARSTKSTTMSVKKSESLKPYKKRFSVPYKKVAKTLGILALLGASGYGAKKLYDRRVRQPMVVVTGTQEKPQLRIIIPEVPATPVFQVPTPKIPIPPPQPQPLVPKTPIPVISRTPKGPTPEEILFAKKLQEQMDAYYLLQKEFGKSKAALFASERRENLHAVCSDYNEFLKYYNEGCRLSQEVLNPRKNKGRIGECRKKYMKRDKIDTELVEKLIKLFNC
jgi:hypothetical protein